MKHLIVGLYLALAVTALSAQPATSNPLPIDSLAEKAATRASYLLDAYEADTALNIGRWLLTYAQQTAQPRYESVAQSVIGRSLFIQGDRAGGRLAFEALMVLNRRTFGNNSPELAVAHNNLGSILNEYGLPDEAMVYLQQALAICRTPGVTCADRSLGNLYNNLGVAYELLGNFAESEDWHQRARTIREPHRLDTRFNLLSTYINLGSLYLNMGEQALARDYSLRAESLLYEQTKGDTLSPDLLFIFQNLGVVAYYYHEYEVAKKYYRRALHIGAVSMHDAYQQHAPLLFNYANILLSQDSLDQAETYFKQAEVQFENDFGGQHPDQMLASLNQGQLLELRGQFAEAMQRYEVVLAQDSAFFPEEHYRRAYTLRVMANCLHRQKIHAAAERYYLAALAASGLPKLNPAGLERADRNHDLLAILTDFGRLRLEEHRPADALAIFELADSLVGLLRVQKLDGKGQTELLRDARKLYESAIQASLAHEGRHSERAFAYAEKGLALQLYGALKERAATRFADLPAETLVRLNSLQQTARSLENQLFSAEKSGLKDSTFYRTQDLLSTTNLELAGLKRQLANQNSKYARYRFGAPLTSVPTVRRQLLPPGHTLLQYFTGDSTIYAVVLRANYYEVTPIPLNFNLKLLVEQLRHGIEGTGNGGPKYEASLNEYIAAALELYQRLVAPLASQLTDNLMIVPDGALCRIPFEALLLKAPTQRRYPGQFDYLLKHHVVRYGYSASLLYEMSHQPPVAFSGELLACAPFAANKGVQRHRILAQSEEEVKAAVKALGSGEVLRNEQATLANFRAKAPGKRLLLLATHGEANNTDGDRSSLFFFPDADPKSATGYAPNDAVLYTHDLYGMSLPAEMAILSACETQAGALLPGEGLGSIARAFAYAGTQRLVATLWSAHDGSTSTLVSHLLQQLPQHHDSAASLTAAKRQWLEEAPVQVQGPYFWAGLVQIGL